jgi:hypothetical protein
MERSPSAVFFFPSPDSIFFTRPDCMTIQVHYAGIEGEGRDAPGLGQIHDGLHPMAREELEVVSASR